MVVLVKFSDLENFCIFDVNVGFRGHRQKHVALWLTSVLTCARS